MDLVELRGCVHKRPGCSHRGLMMKISRGTHALMEWALMGNEALYQVGLQNNLSNTLRNTGSRNWRTSFRAFWNNKPGICLPELSTLEEISWFQRNSGERLPWEEPELDKMKVTQYPHQAEKQTPPWETRRSLVSKQPSICVKSYRASDGRMPIIQRPL